MEDHVQFVVARVLDMADVRWCHCPNGMLRDPMVAGRLTAAGVKAGVPDCLIFGTPHRALELKREKGGRLEPEQADWCKALGELGWEVAIEAGTTAALERLEAWGIDVERCLADVERLLGYRLEGGRLVKVKGPAKAKRSRAKRASTSSVPLHGG